MRKICVINQKGGVGKTTTAINIAAGLALNDKRVLLLDLDTQGHVATYFPIKEYKKDMYDLLTNGANVKECIINIGKNLDVITSSSNMRIAEAMLHKKEDGNEKLKQKMIDVEGEYDYVLIDCPPSIGIITQNAVLYADEAFIPTGTDVLGLDGLRKIIKTINEFNKQFGHKLKISKVIPTLYDKRNKICKKILDELKNEFYGIVTDPIRINSKLKEAPGAKKSIFRYAKSSSGAKDYGKLVDMILHENKGFSEPDLGDQGIIIEKEEAEAEEK